MAAADQPHPLPGRSRLGERLAGFIYGTIVVESVIVAEGRGYFAAPAKLAGLVAATAVVFWLAHVYAHGIGQSLTRGDRLSLRELGHVARHEAAIVEAAVPPVAALLLGAVGVLSTHTAVWLAFGLGLAVLASQGVVFARVEHLNRLTSVIVVAANLGFGLLLVALKLLLSH